MTGRKHVSTRLSHIAIVIDIPLNIENLTLHFHLNLHSGASGDSEIGVIGFDGRLCLRPLLRLLFFGFSDA